MNNIEKKGLISFFVNHKVAANLLMIIIIIMGIFSIIKLNVQTLPTIKTNFIVINVVWKGASSFDIESSIIQKLENNLNDVDSLKKIKSIAKVGVGTVILEFNQDANMAIAFQNVQQRVSSINDLPVDSEKPVITKIEPFEPVAKIIISGVDSKESLRKIAYMYEKELLNLGISKISFNGLYERDLLVKVPLDVLHSLNLSILDLRNQINNQSEDLPLGESAKNLSPQTMRIEQAKKSIEDLMNLNISGTNNSYLYRLGDFAVISLEKRDGESSFYYKGNEAIEMTLLRTVNENSFKMADILYKWYEKQKESNLSNIDIKVYNESWKLVDDRVNLLLSNLLTGLFFILVILMLFLNIRVAFWTAVGIPISLFGAFFVLYLLGGSINMISLFAVIMSLGIIVDDAIVVGEASYVNYHEQKFSPLDSAIIGARRMFVPVLASSLTTIAVFLPLMLIGDIIGQILFQIPLVIVCVIIASLIECFLILPKHLEQSFVKIEQNKVSKFKLLASLKQRLINFHTNFNNGFNNFRDKVIIRYVDRSLNYKFPSILLSLAIIVFSVCLIIFGQVKFTFFPSVDGDDIKVNVILSSGTTEKEVKDFIAFANKQIIELEKKQEKKIVVIVNSVLGKTYDLQNENITLTGDNVAHINIELISPDKRKITNQEFINELSKSLYDYGKINFLEIGEPVKGPPGHDIDIQLFSTNVDNLKNASNALKNILSKYQGVINIKDNLPYGNYEYIYKVNDSAILKGLTARDLASQVNGFLSGSKVESYNIGKDEIDIKVIASDKIKNSIDDLKNLPIKLPNGETLLFSDVSTYTIKRSFNELRHEDLNLVANVTAKVITSIANSNEIIYEIQQNVINNIEQKYQVEASFGGKKEEQAESFADMKFGLIIGIILIYLILALVFSSYLWPIIFMIIIPMGLVGAIFGHLLLGYDLTILSLFGFFGVSGIIINDSIIYVDSYRIYKERGLDKRIALLEATRARFRPIFLTSITTIVGLSPLLFETSIQAQFLIPLAISMIFGISFANLMLVITLVSSLASIEKIKSK